MQLGMGSYTAPPDLLAGIKGEGALHWGSGEGKEREREEMGRGKGIEGRKVERGPLIGRPWSCILRSLKLVSSNIFTAQL